MSNSAMGNTSKKGTKVSEEGKKRIGDAKRGIKQSKECIKKKSKILLQYKKDGTFIKEWENSVIVSNKLKISQGNISSNALGYRKSAGGYTWKFKN